MIKKIFFVIILIIGVQQVDLAQIVVTTDKTTVNFPIIKAGSAYPSPPVPYSSIITPDTFIYKGEVAIILGGDTTIGADNEFIGSYLTNNPGYFHGYLVPPANYAELKPEPDADYVVTIENKVYFRYLEKYDNTALDYKLYDYKRVQKLPSFVLSAPTLGANYYQLDLNNIGLINNAYYMLEVTNSKGEIGYLRIKYIKVN